MYRNSNAGQAVYQILKGCQDEGISFAGLVRQLRKRGYEEISREAVQEQLRRLADEGTFRVLPGGWLSVWPERVVCASDVRYAVHGGCRHRDYYYPEEKMLGYFADWRDAWLVACADFLGDRVRGRAVYRLEEGMWELDSVCGSLNCVELQMPEPEPKPVRRVERHVPTDGDYIEAELDAVKNALASSMHEQVYRRLREDAENGKIALSFAVEVNLDAQTVSAKMSGSIKLVAKGSTHIADPGQLELDFSGDEDDEYEEDEE